MKKHRSRRLLLQEIALLRAVIRSVEWVRIKDEQSNELIVCLFCGAAQESGGHEDSCLLIVLEEAKGRPVSLYGDAWELQPMGTDPAEMEEYAAQAAEEDVPLPFEEPA